MGTEADGVGRAHGPARRRAGAVAALVVLSLLAVVPGEASSAPSSPGPTRVPSTSRYILAGPAPTGVTPLGDYGAGVLVDLSAAQASALTAAGRDLQVLPDAHLLKLNRTVLDTSAALPAVPAGLAAGMSPTSWVVQLVGPAAPGWLEALEAAGLRLVRRGYVPENGWLVRGTSDQIARVARFSFVQAAVPYHPWYRLSPRLDALAGSQELRVLLFDDADLATVATKVAALGATELGRIDDTDVKLLRIRADASRLAALAAMDAVQWIEPVVPLEVRNDKAADTMGVRPVWDGVPEAPGVPLQGEGEIVAVADTGLDTGDVSTMHPDFADHIVDLEAWGRPGPGGDVHTGDPSDNQGHGTHTAGSVVGDGSAWSTLDLTGCTASCDPAKAPKGMAPEAGLVFQSISGPDDSLTGVPEDPGVLYGAAYDAGARIHSNSYGSDAGGAYDAQAFLLDRFLETHPDMLITFSAGNAGNDLGLPDGKIDLGSIGSPATAKNTLAVGASEDQRGPAFTSGDLTGLGTPAYSTYAVFALGGPPFANDTMSNDREGMVAFSSRGPTADGRIKPEIVGIGTHVLSTRSSKIPADQVYAHYWSEASFGSSAGNPLLGDYPATADPFYAFNGGTSMSNPLTAGAATVVRQYLRRVRGISDPSAALLKAALTVGAHELRGQYPARPDVDARPDNNQGWGRVDVQGTVAPGGANKVAFYDDPVGLRTGAVASYPIEIADPTVPLRVQLAWNDVAANLAAAKTLVDDLDLVVISPDGTVYRGNQFLPRAADGATYSAPNPPDANRVDNLEGVQVPAASLTAGTWTVEVRGFTVPAAPEPFALALRGGLGDTPSGAIHLDAAAYKSRGRPITIAVTDAGASGSSVVASVATDSAPGGRRVTLAAEPGVPGLFVGTIGLSEAGAEAADAARIPGADGDQIVVSYRDSGGDLRTAEAVVDNTAPEVSGVMLGQVTPFSADVSFHSSEPAVGTVEAATKPTPAAFSVRATDPALVQDRTVTAGGLEGAARYFYRATATDDPGNTGVGDNDGDLYTFRTPQRIVEYTYDAETEAGWTHTNNSSTAEDQWHLTTRPDAVHGGSRAWLFGPEDPDLTYPTDANATLDSPTLTRTSTSWASLELYANYDTEKGFDGVNVLASDDGGTTYELVPLVSAGPPSGEELASAQIDGNSGGYRLLTFDLSGFEGPTLKLRLQFTSDAGVELSGFAFDDVTVTGSLVQPDTGEMAALFVPHPRPTASAVVKVGAVRLRAGRDWVRLDHLEIARTGTATDADVPSVRLLLPDGTAFSAPFSGGVATLDDLRIDAGVDATKITLQVRVSGSAVHGRTVGLSIDSGDAVLASPDAATGGTLVFPGFTIR